MRTLIIKKYLADFPVKNNSIVYEEKLNECIYSLIILLTICLFLDMACLMLCIYLIFNFFKYVY